MRYWVFTAQTLDDALSAYMNRRQAEGASDEQAGEETRLVERFLIGPEAQAGGLIRGDI